MAAVSQCRLSCLRADSAAAKQFSRCVKFLTRISKEVSFEVVGGNDIGPAILILRSVNAGKSAAVQFRFGKSFFEYVQLPVEGLQGICAAKSLAAVCKGIERAAALDIVANKEGLTLSCVSSAQTSMRKSFCVKCGPPPSQKPRFNPPANFHALRLEPAILSRCFAPLPDTIEVAITIDAEGLTVRSSSEDVNQSHADNLSTSLRISSSEFDEVSLAPNFPAPESICIELKELKGFLSMLSGEGWRVHIFMQGPGDAMLLSSTESPASEALEIQSGSGIVCSMILATSTREDQQGIEPHQFQRQDQASTYRIENSEGSYKKRRYGSLQDNNDKGDESESEIGATPPHP